MAEIFLPIVIITGLFFVFLLGKELLRGKLKENFCVICTAVSLTWISLLVLYWRGLFENQLLIALLLGQTTLGIYYVIDKKIPKLRLFRLPLLLTLIFAGYSLLVVPGDLLKVAVLLVVLWIIFGFVYIYRNNENMNSFVKKVIECCKNW